MLDEIFFDYWDRTVDDLGEWKCIPNDPVHGPDSDGFPCVFADGINEEQLDKRCVYECESEECRDADGDVFYRVTAIGQIIASED